jgi:hypothetical protein
VVDNVIDRSDLATRGSFSRPLVTATFDGRKGLAFKQERSKK